ncbi:MAG TPA: hypothetical protein VNN80_02975 [Polyangiaceae bacterium]|nr:hypothetical protein [Polyangiaceae bacterium]
MGESVAPPSASPGAIASARPRVELGVLRNGLGSIRNLELLIKSIKVGQKGLFAAVSAVHADCASMIASVQGIARALAELGVEPGCAERLSSTLTSSLDDLEGMLAGAVDAGRLSVAQRLRLERDLARCARELGATIPLVSLIERASWPHPSEHTPLDFVYASSAERPDQKSVTVYKSPELDTSGHAVNVDLEAAKMLVALGVALLLDGKPEAHPQLGFELQPGSALVTTIRLGEPVGTRLAISALRLAAPSMLCAEAAARSLGGRFEYDRGARGVCIYWPLS